MMMVMGRRRLSTLLRPGVAKFASERQNSALITERRCSPTIRGDNESEGLQQQQQGRRARDYRAPP